MRRELRFVTPIEALVCFRTLPLFGELPPAELAMLCSAAREQQFRRGRPLLTQGGPAESIHIIVEGRVQESRAGALSRTIGSGESVGVAAVLSQDPHGVDVTALTAVTTLQIDRDDLERLFGEHFSIYHHVLRAVCRATRDERRQLDSAQPQEEIVEVAAGGKELDLVDRLLALRRGLSFAARNVVALAEIATRAVEVRFEPDHRLWSEGDTADDLVVVVSGRLSCRTEHGAAFEIAPGGSCGFADAIAERPRGYTAVVTEPVRGLRIHREAVIDGLEDHPDLAQRCLTAAAGDLFELSMRRAGTGEAAAYTLVPFPGDRW